MIFFLSCFILYCVLLKQHSGNFIVYSCDVTILKSIMAAKTKMTNHKLKADGGMEGHAPDNPRERESKSSLLTCRYI